MSFMFIRECDHFLAELAEQRFSYCEGELLCEVKGKGACSCTKTTQISYFIWPSDLSCSVTWSAVGTAAAAVTWRAWRQ